MSTKKFFKFRVYELCPEAPSWARIKVLTFPRKSKKGKEVELNWTRAVSEKKAGSNAYYYSEHRGTSYEVLFDRDGIKLVAAFKGGQLDRYLSRLKKNQRGDIFPVRSFWAIIERLAEADRRQFLRTPPSQEDFLSPVRVPAPHHRKKS